MGVFVVFLGGLKATAIYTTTEIVLSTAECLQ
jgi:hypothetical protein